MNGQVTLFTLYGIQNSAHYAGKDLKMNNKKRMTNNDKEFICTLLDKGERNMAEIARKVGFSRQAVQSRLRGTTRVNKGGKVGRPGLKFDKTAETMLALRNAGVKWKDIIKTLNISRAKLVSLHYKFVKKEYEIRPDCMTLLNKVAMLKNMGLSDEEVGNELNISKPAVNGMVRVMFNKKYLRKDIDDE